jgi:hypothetical protein
MSEPTLKVLKMIEEGTITAEEGERLLAALKTGSQEVDEGGMEVGPPPPPPSPPPDPEIEPVPVGPPPFWTHVWIYPLVTGIALLAGMGYLTNLLITGGEKLGWLICTIPLALFGGLVALLAWWSTYSRWLHVRIQDDGKKINISLPLPLRPAAWLVRLVRPFVPQLQEVPVDEFILSLANLDNEEGLLVVDVDEGKGEKVQVYFG